MTLNEDVAKMKCGVIGCTNKVIGWFVGELDNRGFTTSGTIPSLITCWCSEHEVDLRPDRNSLGTLHSIDD